MSLTIIAGSPGSGGRRSVIEKLARAVADGRSALLVLPTAGQAASARADAAASAPVGLRVGTLEGAIRHEWSLRGDGRAFVEGLPGDILAERALAAAGVAERPGRGAVALLRAIASRTAAVGSMASGSPPGLSGKLLTALMSYGRELQAHGLVEREEAARSLASSPPPAEVVGVSGFTTFKPAEERLLVAWSRSADVSIELPWRKGCAGTEAIQPLVDRLVVAGADVTDLGVASDGRPPELLRAASELFAGDPPGPGEGQVRLGVAQGDEAEARLITRTVAELIARGAAPESVAIAFPDLARHVGWATHELRDAGIDAAADIDRAATETPFGRALLRLWAFCRQGMGRDDLVAFLRSSFAGVGLAHADRIDAAVRRKGIAAGSEIVGLSGEAYPLIRECRRLAEQKLDAQSARKWKAMADTLLANAYPGASPVVESDALIDAAAHRAFAALLEQSLALGEGDAGPDELMEAYAASRVRIEAEPSAGSVLVTSLKGLTRAPFDHVVIGGLTASEFPRRGAEERMQGDAVGRVVALLGVQPDPEEHARSERLAFYLAVTAPRCSLTLIRREADDEGAALRESVFWDEFLDLYRVPGATELPDTAPRIERLDATDRRRGGHRHARGAVLDDRVRAQLAAIDAVSASAVEAYAACPYRWFVERRLDPEAPDVVFDRMAAGSLAHAALALFQVRLRETEDRVTPRNLSAALELAHACYLEAVAQAPRPQGLAEQRLQADVWPAVERTVRGDATLLPGFVPAYAEWSFGLDDQDEPVDLGGVRLKGRADRIDLGPDGLVITDYKLSASHSLADIEKTGLLQLQLYAAAASQRLDAPVVGGIYRSLKTGDSRGFIDARAGSGFKRNDLVEQDRLRGIIDAAVETARTAVDGMRDGRIEPSPDTTCCQHCAAAAFCPEAML